MKKSLISILLVLSLLLSFAACKKDDAKTDDKSDAVSESSQVGGNENAQGPQDLDDLLGILEEGDAQANAENHAENGTYANGEEADLNIGSENSNGESATMPAPMPEGKPVKVETDNKGNPKNPLFKKYMQNYMADGVYSLSATFSTNEDGVELTMPLTLAQKGNKSFTSMDMMLIAGMNMTTNIISNGQKAYIVFPSMKSYITSSPEETGDMLGDTSSLINYNALRYAGTTMVKYQNKQYLCETYKESGMTTKCYFTFKGNKIKNLERIEMITASGTNIFDGIKMSNDVPDSLFELPKGYKNMDRLAGLMG